MSQATFEKLSDEVKNFLIDLKEDQITGFGDERGAYIEFDSENSKPYSSALLLELVELEFLDFHEDSCLSDLHESVGSEYDPFCESIYDEDDIDPFCESRDNDENEISSYGYAFISMQESFLEFVPNKY